MAGRAAPEPVPPGRALTTGSPLMPLHLWVAVAIVGGIATGVALGETAALLQPIADLFVQLLRMLIAPLIFITLSLAIIGIRGRTAGSIGLRVFLYNLATLGAALVIGIGFAVWIGPGVGVDLSALGGVPDDPGTGAAPTGRSFGDILVGIVPSSIGRAFVEGDVLQVLFLSIVFGFAVNALGAERTKPLVAVLRAVNDVLYRVVGWVVRLAPLGVFAILAAVVGQSGLGVLGALGWYMGVCLIAATVQVVGVHGGAVRLLAGQPIRNMLRALREPLPVAFASVSTAAALPVSMASVPEATGISRRVAGFALPFGAAVGRDSSGIYQVVSVVTIAQLVGEPLAGVQFAVLWVTAILSSWAVSAVPGASFVNLTILLGAMGLPLHLSVLVLAVERPLDHLRTSGNLIGQLSNAVFTGATSGEIGPPGRSRTAAPVT